MNEEAGGVRRGLEGNQPQADLDRLVHLVCGRLVQLADVLLQTALVQRAKLIQPDGGRSGQATSACRDTHLGGVGLPGEGGGNGRDLNVVNVGLRSFAESLQAQDVPVAQVDWRPPLAPQLLFTRQGVDIEAANQ